LSLPEWSLPEWSLTEWSLPEWSLPEWSLPEWSLPEWSLTEGSLPEWSLPEWSLPEWSQPMWSSLTELYSKCSLQALPTYVRLGYEWFELTHMLLGYAPSLAHIYETRVEVTLIDELKTHNTLSVFS
jgi:hypothetical protein